MSDQQSPDSATNDLQATDLNATFASPHRGYRQPRPTPEPIVFTDVRTHEADESSAAQFAFWRFVHNALIHPLLAFPWAPRWAERAHDWTALKIPGAG